MKLLDLLKSLNGGTVANPDDAITASESDAREHDRHRLLDELSSLLELLDAPGASKTPATVSTRDDESTHVAQSLLNLDAIFENPETEDSVSADAARDDRDNEVTPAHQQTHKQLVRSLLDELLPMLEKALGDRLDQLDNDTLAQWTKVAAGANQAPTR